MQNGKVILKQFLPKVPSLQLPSYHRVYVVLFHARCYVQKYDLGWHQTQQVT